MTRKKYAAAIVRTLADAGHRALYAGGCVRDLVLGIEPKDYDIATDARPEEVEALFERTLSVGRAFGVIIVMMGEHLYEVATFRREAGYDDLRHPSEVTFSDEEEDVKRRDFTINGLLYDPLTEEVIDYVGGRDDLMAGVVRAIGDPEARFREDALRLMRAVRFASRFVFEIEPATFAAIRAHAHLIKEISIERVREELVKSLTGAHAGRALRLLDETGLLEAILPEVSALKGVEQPPEFHPEGDVFTHTVIMLDMMEDPSPELMMCALLHDIGKPDTFKVSDRIRFNKHAEVGARLANNVMKRLRFSTRDIERVHDVVYQHMRFKDVKNMRRSKLIRFLRDENFKLHLELHRLDSLASHRSLENYEYCVRMLAEIPEEVIREKPLVTGRDLIAIGLIPGPSFSEILTAVEDKQLEGVLTTKDEALAYVKENLIRKKRVVKKKANKTGSAAQGRTRIKKKRRRR